MTEQEQLRTIGIELDPELEPVTPWNTERLELARRALAHARKRTGSPQVPANWAIHDALDEFEQAMFEVERLQAVARELPEIFQRIRDVEGTMRLLAKVDTTKMSDQEGLNDE